MDDEMPEWLRYGAGLPESLGRCADLFAEVQELRRAMQKEVDEVKRRETEIKQHLIDNISKSEEGGVIGKRYQAVITTDVKPTVADWDKVYDYIFENDRPDLLQKRLNGTAVKALWDDEVAVPGVDKYNHTDVSIRKRQVK
jgi:hypothetical protein